MFKTIRTSKLTKFFVYYLSIMLFLEVTSPMSAYALTSGPAQPEFNSFTPIGTSDMVDLTSGDFNYNIPIMDVGGYPINLAYNSGVSMDQEASWVGLGWNVNIGQINRNVRGIPDDFKGDEITTYNNLKDNINVGVNAYVNPQIIGALDNISIGAGMNVEYNNYHGVSASPSFGISFKLSDNVSVGMQLSSSSDDGLSITPNVKLSGRAQDGVNANSAFCGSISPSITYNSRRGLSSFNLSSNLSYMNGCKDAIGNGSKSFGIDSGSGSISFLNNTFTPTKRQAFKNDNMTFSFSGGPDLWGAHLEGSISAYGSVQSIKDKYKVDKAYGYENTDYATEYDILDFNREKEESSVTKNTLVLPVTNYTYDILTIQGQGVGGMIRPFRGQVGYVYDPKVNDISGSNSIGMEYEGGAGGHIGVNFKNTECTTYTGNWNTVATPFFKEKYSGNNLNYEKVYYKNVGENRVDDEYSALYKNKLSNSDAITLLLDDNKQASFKYLKKFQLNASTGLTPIVDNTGQITNINNLKRSEREKRNQIIQKVTKAEVFKYNLKKFITPNNNAKDHHTVGYIVTDENGTRHIYGESAYNKNKEEVTFATDNSGVDYTKGIKDYNSNEDSTNNSQGIDHYYNRVVTPPYAHTYLISSILSPDYQDLTSNGPSDDDLGTYTKFNYKTFDGYQWRVPYNGVSYNEGLKTDLRDQKASYLYGEKELKYVNRIITKTHVAFIDMVDRADGMGVGGKEGGNSNKIGPRMQRIASIRLYSKAQLSIDNYGNITDPITTPGNIIVRLFPMQRDR